VQVPNAATGDIEAGRIEIQYIQFNEYLKQAFWLRLFGSASHLKAPALVAA
jgi:hypothetical protein